MNTRLKYRLIALFAVALMSHQAAAMEEVVVTGKNLCDSARSVPERIFREMSDYLRDLNQAQKIRIDAELVKLGQRRIQIAAANLPTRG